MLSKALLTSLGLFCLLPCATARQEEPSPQYEALVDEFTLAQKEQRKASSEAENRTEARRIWQEMAPDTTSFSIQFLNLALEHPEHHIAVPSLVWIIENGQDPGHLQVATDTLFNQHIDNESLSSFALALGRRQDPQATVSLEKLLAGSPHEEVRGQACYQLGMKLLSDARQAEQEDNDPTAMRERGEKFLEQVVAEFPTLEGRRKTLGESASAQLFELRRLQIGMVAPEIEGESIDGEPMRLSDYRGKVVVLDFWGDW